MKNNSPNSRSKMILFAMALFALFSSSYAQNPSLKVFEEWRDTVGSQNTFYKASTITIPGTTHVLVCGATLNGNGNGDYDMLVEKIDGTGTVLWAQQYDGPGHGDDIICAFAIQEEAPSLIHIAVLEQMRMQYWLNLIQTVWFNGLRILEEREMNQASSSHLTVSFR
ncbi:MAG TPA: hypothetical protein VK826_15475 [Bacteroidia bacterium]|nr:hypothetical protein [Bacteroidia bacterium]